MGEGEWHAHKHGTSNTRRSFCKLHLAVDSEGFIAASELTDSGVDDASVGVAMIDRIESAIERFTADGAYDTRAIYAVFQEAEPENFKDEFLSPYRTAAGRFWGVRPWGPRHRRYRRCRSRIQGRIRRCPAHTGGSEEHLPRRISHARFAAALKRDSLLPALRIAVGALGTGLCFRLTAVRSLCVEALGQLRKSLRGTPVTELVEMVDGPIHRLLPPTLLRSVGGPTATCSTPEPASN
ncbi:MAG: hypothetical protein ACI9OJ_001107 [Myxococcota bacterium]|jgi:hypothetical protein